MKRNLLFLAMFVVAFCFTGTAMAQDAGNPDTLYLEVWPGDLGVVGSAPHFMKFPLLVTNDIVDPVTDSIAGFVVPICYHADANFGAINYCSTSGYWNGVSIVGPSPEVIENRSCFRHLPDMVTNTMTNRMMA